MAVRCQTFWAFHGTQVSHMCKRPTKFAANTLSFRCFPECALHGCRGALLLQLLDAYAVRYSEMLEGRSEALPVSELAGGARIRHIFQEIFHQGLTDLNPSRSAYHTWHNNVQI